MNKNYHYELVEVIATFYQPGDTETYAVLSTFDEKLWWVGPSHLEVDSDIDTVFDVLVDPEIKDGGDGVFAHEVVVFHFNPIVFPGKEGMYPSGMAWWIDDQGEIAGLCDYLDEYEQIARRHWNASTEMTEFHAVQFILVFEYGFDEGVKDHNGEYLFDPGINITLIGELDLSKIEPAIIPIHSPEGETGAAQ